RKAQLAMQSDRAFVQGITDDGEHLAHPDLLASSNDFEHQRMADATALCVRRDVNRVLARIPISRAGPERTRVRVAGDPTVELSDQERETACLYDVQTLAHFGGRGRHLFERAEAGEHVVRIDFLNARDVRVCAVPDLHGAAFRSRTTRGTLQTSIRPAGTL